MAADELRLAGQPPAIRRRRGARRFSTTGPGAPSRKVTGRPAARDRCRRPRHVCPDPPSPAAARSLGSRPRAAMDGAGGHELALPYFPRRRLVVDFAPDKYGRRPHPDARLEASIDATWAARTARNPSLFNAPKFRLASLSTPADRSCTLHLGLTDYKAFQGTHRPPRPLRAFGRAHMALPLGNVAVVETADARAPVLVRSARVGEGRGRAVFPGGHPEPAALAPPPRPADPRVAAELRHAARREVLEELFLPDACVQPAPDMPLLGIVERRADAKPSMVYGARVSLTGAEVAEAYRQGNADEEESERMILLHVHEIRRLAQGALVCGQFEPMPELVGAAQLWVQMTDWKAG